MAKGTITPSSVAVTNVQGLADIVVGQATSLKTTFDKTGADSKTYINSTLIAELNGDGGSNKIGHDSINVTADNVGDGLEELATTTVKLTGNQTIAGVKTFSSSPIIPAPTTDLQPSTKKYVDDIVNGVVVGTLPDNSVTNAKLGTDIKIGSLAELNTTEKTEVVGAINEVLGGIPTIVNNLTETVEGKTLDATQGKILKDSVDLKAPIDSPTFTTIVTAPTNTTYTTRQVRNVVLSIADASGGSNGDIWFKYE